MKSRFRITIRTALLCVAIVAIGTRWWQTVPDRTAGRFADAIAKRDLGLLGEFGASGMLALSIVEGNGLFHDNSAVAAKITSQPRGLADFLAGRAAFTISLTHEGGEEVSRLYVEVIRYRVLKLGNVKEHHVHSLYIAMSNQPTR